MTHSNTIFHTVGPRVSTTPSHVGSKLQEEVILDCLVDVWPLDGVILGWMFGGKNISRRAGYRTELVHDSPTEYSYTLIIPHIQTHQFGEYHCVAVVEGSRSVEGSMTVTLLGTSIWYNTYSSMP